MKVLLISANTLTDPYPVYPLGLDYVAKSIEKKHDVRVIDMNYKDHANSLGNIIGNFQPDLIGISIRNIDNTDKVYSTGYIRYYRDFIKTIRSFTDSNIVVGGAGFTIFPEELMSHLEVDYGVIGEGERLILLIDALEKQKDTSNIPGIITPSQKQQYPEPWDKSFQRHFEKKSFTDFYLNKGGMLNLQTKRGCCFRCIYCTYPSIEGSSLRLIEPDEVAEEAWRLQNAGAKYIFITDSVFNTHASHSLAVAQAIQKKGITIPWGAYFAPLKPPKNYYQKLAEAGLKHVEFGTESLSAYQLKMYCKPFQLDHVFEAHEEALAADVHVAHYFILGGPGESMETINETFSNAEQLKKTVLFFFCGMRIYPNTALYDIAIDEGIINQSESLLEPVFYLSKSLSEDWIITYANGKKKAVVTGSSVVSVKKQPI